MMETVDINVLSLVDVLTHVPAQDLVSASRRVGEQETMKLVKGLIVRSCIGSGRGLI